MDSEDLLLFKLQRLLSACCEETLAGLFDAASAELGSLRLGLQAMCLSTFTRESSSGAQPMQVEGESERSEEVEFGDLDAEALAELASRRGAAGLIVDGVVTCILNEVRQVVRKTVAAEVSLAPVEYGGLKESRKRRSFKAAAVSSGSAGWMVGTALAFLRFIPRFVCGYCLFIMFACVSEFVN